MPRRRALDTLSPQEQQTLSDAVFDYITEAVLEEHRSGHEWHHPSSPQFFIGHRAFLGKLEAYLAARGLGAYVPLPKWNPVTTIPTPFLRPKPLAGVPLTAMNPNPGVPVPPNVLAPCQYDDLSDYVAAVESWHGTVHLTVGGALAPLRYSPAALIFWPWHAYIDDLYYDWELCPAYYRHFDLQTGTALHPTGAQWQFCVAGNRDVIGIKKNGTESGRTEIHVLSAGSNYSAFSLHAASALHPTDGNWDFAIAPNRDLFAVKKNGGSGTTEIHVLSAASDYSELSLQAATALHPTDANWDFLVAGNRDVVAVKKRGGDSGMTEVHVLSAGDDYASFNLHARTALHETDGTWNFGINRRDVFAIRKSGTGTGRTEVHVLSAGDDYATFALQTGTVLHPTDDTFEFGVGPSDELFAIKKSGTGTGSTEVHVLRR